MLRQTFFSASAAILLLVFIVATPSSFTSSSSSSSSALMFASAGPLEDLLAEGIDMLSGQPARDSADRQLRDARKQKGGRDVEACPKFACENAKHKFRHKATYVPDSNGCGSYGFKIHSAWHEACCDVHDKCYGTCGKLRDGCDKAFKACMEKACKNSKSKKDRDACDGQRQMFFTATRSLGCQAYLDSQKVACECYDGAAAIDTAASKKGVDAKSAKASQEQKPRKNTPRPQKEEL